MHNFCCKFLDEEHDLQRNVYNKWFKTTEQQCKMAQHVALSLF